MSAHFGTKLRLWFISQCQLCLPKYKKWKETKSSILELSPLGLISAIYYTASLVILAISGDPRVLLEIQNLYVQGQSLGIDIMYLVRADRNMQVRFGLKVVWGS